MSGQRRTAKDLADAMALDIQGGAFAPGAWLKQIDLERRYRSSRLDVRRALDLLVQARLVEHLPKRGFYVSRADDQTAAEIRDLRLILELAAVEAIVGRVRSKDLRHLRELAERFDGLIATGTVVEQYEANLAFHAALLSLHPNSELPRLVASLRARLSSAPASQWRTLARVRQSSREHFQMVVALEEQSVDRLRYLVEAHIMQTSETPDTGFEAG